MSDAAKMSDYDRRKSSMGVAYLLWFFLAGFGAHRFYLGQHGTAVVMLLLFIIGWVFTWTVILSIVGAALLIAWSIWWFVDLFLTKSMVDRSNEILHAQIFRN